MSIKFSKKENTHFRDYRGIECPTNFARITVDLMDIPTGDFLEVLLDDGLPATNVPGSLIREGQHVISMMQNGTFWRLTVQKIVD